MTERIQQRALARDPANKVSVEFPLTSAVESPTVLNTSKIKLKNTMFQLVLLSVCWESLFQKLWKEWLMMININWQGSKIYTIQYILCWFYRYKIWPVLTFWHNVLDLLSNKVICNWQEFILSIPTGGCIFPAVTASPALTGIQKLTETK